MNKTLTALVDRVGNEQLLTKPLESARKFWLFGLGAYSLACKSGARTIETLVQQGKAFEPKARQQIAEKSAELLSSASGKLQRGEELVKERLIRPLDFLVVASKRDVELLTMRVIQLSAEVRSLTGGKAKPITKPLSKPSSKPAARVAAKPEAKPAAADASPMMATAT